MEEKGGARRRTKEKNISTSASKGDDGYFYGEFRPKKRKIEWVHQPHQSELRVRFDY